VRRGSEPLRNGSLRAGTVYIGRGDADLVVAPRSTGVPRHPSVQRMVASALEQFDAADLIGVLMTGMGNEGAEAMTRLRATGGRPSRRPNLPPWCGACRENWKKGGADFIQAVDDIAAAIIKLVVAIKTMKYQPQFPQRFGRSLSAARRRRRRWPMNLRRTSRRWVGVTPRRDGKARP
jgi:chemotaxis response regulator CheB